MVSLPLSPFTVPLIDMGRLCGGSRGAKPVLVWPGLIGSLGMRSLKSDTIYRTIYFYDGEARYQYSGYASMDYEEGQEIMTTNGLWIVTHLIEYEDTHVALVICRSDRGKNGWITDAMTAPGPAKRADVDAWLAG
jgi:hypothetical protein